MRENMDQNNSEYGHILRSVFLKSILVKLDLLAVRERQWKSVIILP